LYQTKFDSTNLSYFWRRGQSRILQDSVKNASEPAAAPRSAAWRAPCDAFGVRALLIVLLLAAPGGADAAGAHDLATHVRTSDPYLRAMLRDAVAQSPCFRTLVARLVRSDVVVYLTRAAVVSGLDAHLSFVSSAGGFRYLAIRLSSALPPRRLVAMMAHELQHAVEIADAPWIVDGPTLAREYERSGIVNWWYGVKAFDSGAAILAGERAWEEIGEWEAR
jgi:hypothetical protein